MSVGAHIGSLRWRIEQMQPGDAIVHEVAQGGVRKVIQSSNVDDPAEFSTGSVLIVKSDLSVVEAVAIIRGDKREPLSDPEGVKELLECLKPGEGVFLLSKSEAGLLPVSIENALMVNYSMARINGFWVERFG